MKKCNSQSGVMLLEAMIGVLIFSFGILAIVGLQAVSIKQAGDAQFRSEAGLLANQLLSEMWVSDRTAATLSTNFSSAGAGGAAYNTWLANVQATLPGVTANPPTVVVDTGATVAADAGQVTITVFWKSPSEPEADAAHSYVLMAQVK